jgi:nucleoside 2-deoxyribosyltransferase
MRVSKPPEIVELSGATTVFLAGSIENGVAELWQDIIVEMLKDTDIHIFNPRRDNWNKNLEQKIDNPQFREQVEWELDYIEKADYVIFYFDPYTKSPITLLELGLTASKKPSRCIVICNEPFYRKGNVDIVCERYKIKQVSTLEEAIKLLT